MHKKKRYHENFFIRFNVLKDIITAITLSCVDIIAICGAFVCAYVMRNYLGNLIPAVPLLRFPPEYFLSFWWIVLVFIFFIGYNGLYTKKLVFWHEAELLIKAATTALVFVLAILTLGKVAHKISRLTTVLLWANSLWLLPLCRMIGVGILNRFKLGIENVLIVGAGETGKEIAKIINKDEHLGFRVKGFLDDNEEIIGKNIEIDDEQYPVFAKTNQHRKFIKQFKIAIVIFAMPSLPYKKLLMLNNIIQHHVKRVLFIRDLKGIGMLNTERYDIFMQPLLMFNIKNNLRIPANMFLKRILDIAISLILLPFLLVVIAIIGTIIKVTSPGPIFYTHKRVGYKGKPIKLYKFRSMYIDAEKQLEKLLKSNPEAKREWEIYRKIKDDPRVTKIGRFLRKWSIDELPQIFNVLKSDISLVGPRPAMKEEMKKYFKRDRIYYFMVKPGITGLWQISGRNILSYDFRVDRDIWYALNWSLWTDLVILFKTVTTVIKRKGAY